MIISIYIECAFNITYLQSIAKGRQPAAAAQFESPLLTQLEVPLDRLPDGSQILSHEMSWELLQHKKAPPSA
jgi:hypothetical protein